MVTGKSLLFTHNRSQILEQLMKYSDSIKPISDLKTHASEVVRDIYDNKQVQESFALLEVLAQSSASIERGEYKPVVEAFEAIKDRALY
jgi:hypothetical protein